MAEKLPQQPKNPDDFEKETAQFWEQEKEKAVDALQEALHIDRAVKLCVDYIEKGILTHDMPLIKALEELEKRKLKLVDIKPEEEENEE